LVAGFGEEDKLDLTDIAFGSSTTANFVEAANNTSGTLTVTEGSDTANIVLLGQYVTGNFSLASDGHGGTLVTNALTRVNTVLADLASDWSDTSNPNATNPNGTWEYRAGTLDLSSLSSWLPLHQPAWAGGTVYGGFLPGWFKSTSSLQAGYIDLNPGEVGVHTNDSANGAVPGDANVLFTSNITAPVVISGRLWNADMGGPAPDRSLGFTLYCDGTLIDSGTLTFAETTRSNPAKFSIPEAISPGSQIELDVYSLQSLGTWAGVNLTISQALVVTIGGTAEDGQTLTADAVNQLNGAITDYQWQAFNGTKWTNITGAIGNSFVVTEAYEGEKIRVKATSTEPDGSGASGVSRATVV
jgi:hypothetical protein